MSVSTLGLSLTSSIRGFFNRFDLRNPERISSVSGFFVVLMSVLMLASCRPAEVSPSEGAYDEDVLGGSDYLGLEPFADSLGTMVRVVVEIPAGSNEKIEINKDTGVFETDRFVSYLPYPVNYGFVPGTYSDPESGGDGDPMDVLLLSARAVTGTMVVGYPLATLKLVDNGEEDAKLLVVPADSSLRILSCISWECIQEAYPGVPDLLEGWFLTYKGSGSTRSDGWADSLETRAIIQRHVP
jgi:inorganic pyrophosphatase